MAGLNIPDRYSGVVSFKTKETDFQAGGSLVFPKARSTYYALKTQYKQDEVSYNSCTLHAAIGCVTSLTGYVYTLAEREALWAKAKTLGASDDTGWGMSEAIDLVRNDYNSKHPNDPLMSFSVTLGDQHFFDIIDLGYGIQIGYNGNSTYNTDAKHDGDDTLNMTSFGAGTYKHIITINNSDATNLLVVDSYPQYENDTYKVPRSHIQPLVDSGCYYGSGYFFVFANDFKAANTTPSQVPIWATSAVSSAITKGLITPRDDVNKIICQDLQIEDFLVKLGVFTQKTGAITLARWLVALQRMGKL